MNSERPFMLLRARSRPEVRPEFRDWYRSSHLPEVLRIPGVVSVESGETPAGTRLGWYYFESAAVVQAALSSREAAAARAGWARWASDLEELSIELFSPLFPLPLYHSPS